MSCFPVKKHILETSLTYLKQNYLRFYDVFSKKSWIKFIFSTPRINQIQVFFYYLNHILHILFIFFSAKMLLKNAFSPVLSAVTRLNIFACITTSLCRVLNKILCSEQ